MGSWDVDPSGDWNDAWLDSYAQRGCSLTPSERDRPAMTDAVWRGSLFAHRLRAKAVHEAERSAAAARRCSDDRVGRGGTAVSQELMSQFLDACGARGPLELKVEDATGTQVGHWVLPQPFALLGSDAQADVRLAGEDVSKRHVYLQILGGRVFGVDLESRSGVKWGGIRASSWWVRPGESFEVGSYLVKVRAGAPGDPCPDETELADLTDWENPLREAVVPASEGAVPWLEVPGTEIRKPLTRRMTLLGRSNDCRLRVPDERLSRHHCSILRTQAGVWVVDLLSREGIRLDGVRVRWARIGARDELRIARYRVGLTMRPASERGALRVVARPSEFPLERRRSANLPQRLQVPGDPVLLEPMLQQFGEMQQQMIDRFSEMQAQAFDQVHQMMSMMVQMFGSLHRDQMKEVRGELKKIRDLTLELQGLQGQVSDHDPSRPTSRAPTGTHAAHASPGSVGTTVEEPRRRGATAGTGSPPAGVEKATGGTGPAPTSTGRRVVSSDIHSYLCERIEKLQEERSSRWQRILVMMTGSAV